MLPHQLVQRDRALASSGILFGERTNFPLVRFDNDCLRILEPLLRTLLNLGSVLVVPADCPVGLLRLVV